MTPGRAQSAARSVLTSTGQGAIMMKLMFVFFVVAGAACGPVGDPDTNARIEQDLPPASTFRCSQLTDHPTACVDFTDGKSDQFVTEGGEWQVIDGRYIGWGPDAAAPPCADSLMTHAIFQQVEAQDFSLHAQLDSVKRVDKVITFRSADPANRVQINFRDVDAQGHFGDVMVQEIKNCVFTKFTHDGQIPLPHPMNNPIAVDLDVQGAHLTVKVDGNTVIDADEPFAVRSGKIGFGVIDHSETVFDDFVVRKKD
jgi:hypothetical protein